MGGEKVLRLNGRVKEVLATRLRKRGE